MYYLRYIKIKREGANNIDVFQEFNLRELLSFFLRKTEADVGEFEPP